MKRRDWSESDLTFLSDNYLKLTREELSQSLNCPKSILARKMKELGYHKRTAPPGVGDTVNRLTIKELVLVQVGKQQKTVAICDCSCGNVTKQKLTDIQSERIKSCGCWKAEKASATCTRKNYRHGKSDLKTNKLYRVWSAMKSRCYNENVKYFKDYGGRGIRVCDEWLHDYEAFDKWSYTNGYGEHLSIDRIDVNGHYEPANCRWATSKQQAANRRNNRINTVLITAFGETKHLLDWLTDERCKVKAATNICYRIGSGWTPENAISMPSQREKESKIPA